MQPRRGRRGRSLVYGGNLIRLVAVSDDVTKTPHSSTRQHQQAEQQEESTASGHGFLPLGGKLSEYVAHRVPEAPLRDAFESLLEDVATRYPALRIIRLDTDERFRDPDLYEDLIHLNRTGRTLATDLFLAALADGPPP